MHLICLHNVIPEPLDAFDKRCSRNSTTEFERFLDATAARFDLVSYDEYEVRLRSGSESEDCVALSFDDGFRGVFDHAAPVLADRGLNAIAFINPPFLGNPDGILFHFLELEIAFRLTEVDRLSVSFHDEILDLSDESARIDAMRRVKKLLKTSPEERRARGHEEVLAGLNVGQADVLEYARTQPKFHIMDPAHLEKLHASGWTIGSHAMTHRTLSMLPDAELEAEIDEAWQAIEARFGWSGLPFAYPYGDVVHVGHEAPRVCADRGHRVAYTTVPGPSDLHAAPHLLPRIDYKRFVKDYLGW